MFSVSLSLPSPVPPLWHQGAIHHGNGRIIGAPSPQVQVTAVASVTTETWAMSLRDGSQVTWMKWHSGETEGCDFFFSMPWERQDFLLSICPNKPPRVVPRALIQGNVVPSSPIHIEFPSSDGGATSMTRGYFFPLFFLLFSASKRVFFERPPRENKWFSLSKTYGGRNWSVHVWRGIKGNVSAVFHTLDDYCRNWQKEQKRQINESTSRATPLFLPVAGLFADRRNVSQFQKKVILGTFITLPSCGPYFMSSAVS